jgi:hypothetical protein
MRRARSAQLVFRASTHTSFVPLFSDPSFYVNRLPNVFLKSNSELHNEQTGAADITRFADRRYVT